MANNNYITKDLTLVAFLKIKGFSYTAEKDQNLGIFTFDATVKDTATKFYQNEGEFLLYSNAIKDLKRELKSI